MYEYDRLFIGGKWREALSSRRLLVHSPATEELIGSAVDAGEEDIDQAVLAARRALDESDWGCSTASDRAGVLLAAAEWLDSNKDVLTRLLADEAGVPVGTNAGVQNAVDRCRFYADLTRGFPFEQVRSGKGGDVLVRHEPIGVVAAIVPWNAPLGLAFMKIAPAIAAGCAVVLKPSPETPLSACLLAKMAEDIGLPDGVLNIVPAGTAGSVALVAHAGVDAVSFTGSTQIGSTIGEVCGRLVRHCTLELGGKSAAILLDDVDIEAIMPGLIRCALSNNGQACILQSRILVPRHREAEFAEAYIEAVRALPVGDPHAIETRVGPLINATQRARVLRYVETGQAEGARLLFGGTKPQAHARGHYVTPAVFAGVSNDMRIAREEIFGPVTAIIPYEGDPVAVANDSPYGLSGSVWTSEPARGLAVARRVRTGNFGINRFGMDVVAPFGGYKQSGLGRENGVEGMTELMELKSIHLPQGFVPQATDNR